MSALNSRKEMIESLLKYLPNISSSLNDLVNYLQNILSDSVIDKKESVRPTLNQLNRVLPALKSLVEEIPLKTESVDPDPEIWEVYGESFKNIVLGTTYLIRWLTDEKEPNQVLNESIDYLFQGGQQIIKLVDILTEK